MRDFLIYADVDGVLTPCQKIFHCCDKRDVHPRSMSMNRTPLEVEARWYKVFSDRDSYVMLLMKDDLVFISNDRRNKHYTDYKGHKFCYVSHDKDKYYGLAADWEKRVANEEVEGDPFTPRYFYIGDAPFDWLCLRHAIHGFMPSDCSVVLYHKWKNDVTGLHITRLDTKGGEGCLEEMVYAMMRRHDIQGIPGVKDLPVIKAISEFIDGNVQ